MKFPPRRLGRLGLLGVLVFATNAVAQAGVEETLKGSAEQTVTTTTTTTTMTSSGTVSEFSPGTLVVKTTTSEDPIRYAYTRSTTFVDESGKVVSIENVRAGLPVTVYSEKSGGELVATRVVATRAVHPDPYHD